MYKKTITYEDYNGTTRTEDFYFNLSKAELLEMELATPGGYQGFLERVIKAKDQEQITRLFKELILMTYGVKSDDGKRFIKNDQVREEFMQTEAYSDLYLLLATDDDEAQMFVNGVMPKSLRDQISQEDLDKTKKAIEDGTFTGFNNTADHKTGDTNAAAVNTK